MALTEKVKKKKKRKNKCGAFEVMQYGEVFMVVVTENIFYFFKTLPKFLIEGKQRWKIDH